MKNLNLNKYGVQEMNAEEMRETEGGFIPLFILVVAAIVAVVGTAIAMGAPVKIE